MTPEALIHVEGLYHHYEEGVPALDGVDLRVADGAFLAIVGQNGSGKTTLVKHLNALLLPSAGRVLVSGVDTRTTTVARLARTVGLVFQNPDQQIYSSSTRDEVSVGLRNLGLPQGEVQSRAEEALAEFRLTEYADVPPAVLGFGLRRLVAVASVYAMRPRILVLDEPTTGLDRRTARELMARVCRLREAGHTILMVTHDMRLVAEYAPETLVMHAGRALAHGPTRQVLAQAEDLARARIALPQVTRLARRLAPLGMPDDTLTVDEFCRAYERVAASRREGRG